MEIGNNEQILRMIKPGYAPTQGKWSGIDNDGFICPLTDGVVKGLIGVITPDPYDFITPYKGWVVDAIDQLITLDEGMVPANTNGGDKLFVDANGDLTATDDGSKPVCVIDSGNVVRLISQYDDASSGGSGGGGTTPAEKAKLALIDGTTAINFDEVILDGDRATSADVDDPNADSTTVQRFISIATLRHALTHYQQLIDMGDLHTFVAGKNLVAKLMELKTQIDKNSHSSSTAAEAIKFSVQVNVDGASGGFIMADFDNVIANPANPGKDIKDGTKHYVQFLEKNHPIPHDTTWIWLTDGGATKRLWTNKAKTKAVGGIEMATWISVGALIEIQKDTDEWYVSDVHLPAVPQGTTKAILNDGSIKMDSSYAPTDDYDVAIMKEIAKLPTADGEYKLKIDSGVATWVSI